MIEEIINQQKIPKLKFLKLNSLLTSENQVQKTFMKTERLRQKYNSRLSIIRYPTQPINTQTKNFINNNNKKHKENYKRIIKKRYNNIPSSLPFPLLPSVNKKKKNKINTNSNNNNICTLKSIEGYNNYLKEKTNKEYMKINRMLMEQTLYRLSLPKFKRAKRGETTKKEKIQNFDINDNGKFEDYFNADADMEEKNEKLKIEKRHKNKIKNSLYEKERIKCREKFIFLLKSNFKELDKCEKKFDKVIDKTLKLLSDYKISLSYLKNNNDKFNDLYI